MARVVPQPPPPKNEGASCRGPAIGVRSARGMPGQHLNFSVVTEITGDGRRVRPSGELDIAAREELDLALTAAEATGVGDVVLDLRAVSFMDSAGVHAAVESDRRCRAIGRSLRVVPGPERIQRLFRLTGTDALIPFGRT